MECSWCCYLRCFSDSAGARALGTVVPAGPRNKNLEEHKTKIFATVCKCMESGVSSYCIVTREAKKGGTGQIYQALLTSQNDQTAWPVEPFIYSQMIYFMQIVLNMITPIILMVL